jgi:YidC/Oxa1 family membrane protein insertase
MQDNKNVLLATILSAVILISWTWFYEKPRMEQREIQRKAAIIEQEKIIQIKKQQNSNLKSKVKAVNKIEDKNSEQNSEIITDNKDLARVPTKSSLLLLELRKAILSQSADKRIKISTDSLHGSIYLKGARFDDLTLAKYFEDIDKKEEVVLLAPSKSKEKYFADFGFVTSSQNLELPKPDTIWQSNSEVLSVDHPVILSWKNSQNVEFLIKIKIDKNYMFEVTQMVKNNSNHEIALSFYGRINRILSDLHKPMMILHEGAIGAFNGILQEVSYKKLTKEGDQIFESKKPGGWLGITDKYWLTSLIPDKELNYQASFSYNTNNQNAILNTEFISTQLTIAANGEAQFNHHFFAGAKKVKLLDQYSKDYDIKLFDRAIDFGWFYFLTKPFFSILQFLNKFFGNFGLAILAITVIIKLALFPVANKSYSAINKVKKLQPKIEAIKAQFKDDRVALNREIMALYKKEKVNPASGCLPILIQIPIFFSLYKVLYVTIDMRHEPFYGWIKDLSAPDPTSIFNLFGMLPYDVSGNFMVGIWPILMGITMIIQQRFSPQIADPTQAKVMKFLPYILIFVFASFPAGLLIYWTWSNILSIIQQWVINNKHG